MTSKTFADNVAHVRPLQIEPASDPFHRMAPARQQQPPLSQVSPITKIAQFLSSPGTAPQACQPSTLYRAFDIVADGVRKRLLLPCTQSVSCTAETSTAGNLNPSQTVKIVLPTNTNLVLTSQDDTVSSSYTPASSITKLKSAPYMSHHLPANPATTALLRAKISGNSGKSANRDSSETSPVQGRIVQRIPVRILRTDGRSGATSSFPVSLNESAQSQYAYIKKPGGAIRKISVVSVPQKSTTVNMTQTSEQPTNVEHNVYTKTTTESCDSQKFDGLRQIRIVKVASGEASATSIVKPVACSSGSTQSVFKLNKGICILKSNTTNDGNCKNTHNEPSPILEEVRDTTENFELVHPTSSPIANVSVLGTLPAINNKVCPRAHRRQDNASSFRQSEKLSNCIKSESPDRSLSAGNDPWNDSSGSKVEQAGMHSKVEDEQLENSGFQDINLKIESCYSLPPQVYEETGIQNEPAVSEARGGQISSYDTTARPKCRETTDHSDMKSLSEIKEPVLRPRAGRRKPLAHEIRHFIQKEPDVTSSGSTTDESSDDEEYFLRGNRSRNVVAQHVDAHWQNRSTPLSHDDTICDLLMDVEEIDDSETTSDEAEELGTMETISTVVNTGCERDSGDLHCPVENGAMILKLNENNPTIVGQNISEMLAHGPDKYAKAPRNLEIPIETVHLSTNKCKHIENPSSDREQQNKVISLKRTAFIEQKDSPSHGFSSDTDTASETEYNASYDLPMRTETVDRSLSTSLLADTNFQNAGVSARQDSRIICMDTVTSRKLDTKSKATEHDQTILPGDTEGKNRQETQQKQSKKDAKEETAHTGMSSNEQMTDKQIFKTKPCVVALRKLDFSEASVIDLRCWNQHDFGENMSHYIGLDDINETHCWCHKGTKYRPLPLLSVMCNRITGIFGNQCQCKGKCAKSECDQSTKLIKQRFKSYKIIERNGRAILVSMDTTIPSLTDNAGKCDENMSVDNLGCDSEDASIPVSAGNNLISCPSVVPEVKRKRKRGRANRKNKYVKKRKPKYIVSKTADYEIPLITTSDSKETSSFTSVSVTSQQAIIGTELSPQELKINQLKESLKQKMAALDEIRRKRMNKNTADESITLH